MDRVIGTQGRNTGSIEKRRLEPQATAARLRGVAGCASTLSNSICFRAMSLTLIVRVAGCGFAAGPLRRRPIFQRSLPEAEADGADFRGFRPRRESQMELDVDVSP